MIREFSISANRIANTYMEIFAIRSLVEISGSTLRSLIERLVLFKKAEKSKLIKLVLFKSPREVLYIPLVPMVDKGDANIGVATQ